MYGKALKFGININKQSTIKFRLYPSNYFSSVSSTQPNKESNFVDDIRKSASGLPPSASSSPTPPLDDRVNVVRTSTTPPNSSQPTSSPFTDKRDNRNNNDGDMSSYVADTAKQGVVKAVETGLEIGEMAKKTLDNVWNVTKDTSNAVKDAVAGDDKPNNDVPPTDKFVDDLRRKQYGYDSRKN